MSVNDFLNDLSVLVEGRDDPKSASMPSESDCLYSGPAPDNATRKCANCIFWGASQDLCALLHAKESVSKDNVCGMHVFGACQKTRIDFQGIQTLSAKQVGLKSTKDGASCSCCKWFTDGTEEGLGTCASVYRKKKPATVSKAGFCTRWSQKSDVVPDPEDKGAER